MEPDSELLSAMQFVEPAVEPAPEKNPDWDRESDWSEATSIAWSEDEDDRLMNEILHTHDDNSKERYSLLCLEFFDMPEATFKDVKQWYFQNVNYQEEHGVFYNLDNFFNIDEAAVAQIQEILSVDCPSLWAQLQDQMSTH